jgi:hypothetical protein
MVALDRGWRSALMRLEERSLWELEVGGLLLPVIPAQAGIQLFKSWFPVSTGTSLDSRFHGNDNSDT